MQLRFFFVSTSSLGKLFHAGSISSIGTHFYHMSELASMNWINKFRSSVPALICRLILSIVLGVRGPSSLNVVHVIGVTVVSSGVQGRKGWAWLLGSYRYPPPPSPPSSSFLFYFRSSFSFYTSVVYHFLRHTSCKYCIDYIYLLPWLTLTVFISVKYISSIVKIFICIHTFSLKW